MGPPNPHGGEKNVVVRWGWVRGQACVSVVLAPLADQTPVGPGGDIAGKSTPLKPGWNNTTGGERPGWATIWKLSKMAFLNLRGTMGRKVPSPARRWAPVWRKANLKDVPPSNRCVSGQWCCLVAISSKSTGSVAIVVATDPVACGVGQDKKSATTFFKPDKYNYCTLNSETNARWHCCLGEMGDETHERARTRSLWSSKVGKLDLRKNYGNVWLLSERPIICGQMLNNKTLCLWVCKKRIQVAANGLLIFAAWPLQYEYRKRQWPKKV